MAAMFLALGFRRLGLQHFQIGVEAIETFLEEPAIVFEPVVDVLERLRLDAAGAELRFAAARDQAGALQHLEMLGDRRQAHGERFCQFHDGGFAERQAGQDGAAGRIGERGEGGVEVHEPPG